MHRAGWNSNDFDHETMEMVWSDSCLNSKGGTGGFRYKCSQDGYTFVSSSDKTCAPCYTNMRGGASPADGSCVMCDLGYIFDETAANGGYCAKAKEYTKTDLQYGDVRTKNTANMPLADQCWTDTSPDRYRQCVFNGYMPPES